MAQLWQIQLSDMTAYSYHFSEMLRMAIQPRARYRQFCDAQDASTAGLHAGDKYYWERFGDIDASADSWIAENEPMPEGSFTYSQGSLTLKSFGKGVNYSGQYNDFSRVPVTQLIEKQLKNHAVKVLDKQASDEFRKTKLYVAPVGGTSTTALDVSTSGSTAVTNNVALNDSHVKLIADFMKERNIPAYDGANYCAIGRTSAFRTFKDQLEAKHVYVEPGFQAMLRGEIGRHYDGVRFFEQTNIPSAGWTNGKSDIVHFFGEDTVAEAIVIPTEIRGKLASNYGLSRGIAWYMLGGYGIVHDTAVESRIVQWASAA